MFHTIVVGGGVAGLHVGIEIAKRGQSCCIIDVYHCGGRVQTYHLPDTKLHWENGAGRIHSSHYRTLRYLKRYKCTMIPLSTDIQYLSPSSIMSPSSTISEPNLFFDTQRSFLQPLYSLPPHLLATHTLGELIPRILPHSREFIQAFPYYAELHTLRADIALESFTMAIGGHDHFSICKEGLSTMIDKMKEEFLSHSGTIIENMRITEVIQMGTHTVLRATHRTEHTMHAFDTTICVLAVPKNAVEALLPSVRPITRHLASVPLLRIYAVFPVPWFDQPSTVVDSPIRYIIPISSTAMMISYTEGPYASHWMKMKPNQARRAVMKEIRRLFPDRTIPTPTTFTMHPWREGCTYWLPGNYDVDVMSQKIMNPAKGIFVCGESYARHQCWIESALEHADAMLKRMIA